MNNYGQWYIHLLNRTCDVEYEIPLLRAPYWMEQLTDDRNSYTL